MNIHINTSFFVAQKEWKEVILILYTPTPLTYSILSYGFMQLPNQVNTILCNIITTNIDIKNVLFTTHTYIYTHISSRHKNNTDNIGNIIITNDNITTTTTTITNDNNQNNNNNSHLM